MKPQVNLKALGTGFAILIVTLLICGLLTALVLLPSGYPMW